MKLIVTHEQPDLDAVASLALARLAHPGAVATVTGALTENVRAVLHLYRDQLDLVEAGDVDLDEVRELIVVDTADRRRIRPFDALLGRVPVTLYDHHPPGDAPIPAAHGVLEGVGANVTLLLRHLRAAGVEVPAPIASLALLGLHEDTGNLSYAGTTADDCEAAAMLLRAGANLELVRDFTRDPYDEEHRAFFRRMLEHAETVRVLGRTVTVSAFEQQGYLQGISGLTSQLLSLHGSDAALAIVRMDDKTLVVARALRGFDLGAALAEAFEGGGHPAAAFARTDLPPREARERALAALARHGEPVLRARDVMSAPVKTLQADDLVRDAQRLLVRYGHNGAPVLDEHGTLVGVLSRRDLERALRHELGRSRVAGFMTRQVVHAAPDATLDELEGLIKARNVGRLPILDEGRLVGIVTRSDLLAARHAPARDAGVAGRAVARLPSRAREVLELAAEERRGAALYLVGGTVRDALLGRSLVDLDVAVEGEEARELGARLQRRLGGQLAYHAAFGTCTLSLPEGLVLDLATAREEVYAHPGALPDVIPSTMRRDLSRRDFSVNAMAVRVAPGPPRLLDPFGGQEDLARRELRLLHPLSFIEDPTRILRGARLAGRLDFRFERGTRERAQAAIEAGAARSVSRARLRAELELTLAEDRVAPALARLDEIGAVATVFGLRFDGALVGALDAERREREVPDEAYLLALLLRAGPAAAERALERFHWPRRLRATLRLVAEAEASGSVGERELEGLEEAGRAVLRALGGELAARVRTLESAPQRRKLRGRDVIDLGLPPGPRVGRILAEVATARDEARVATFEEELELARRLADELPGGAAADGDGTPQTNPDDRQETA